MNFILNNSEVLSDNLIGDKLTILQEVALEALRDSMLYASKHSADFYLNAYVLLIGNIERKVFKWLYNYLAEVDEKELCKIKAYIIADETPTYLLINKMVKDIEFSKYSKSIKKSKFSTQFKLLTIYYPELITPLVESILSNTALAYMHDIVNANYMEFINDEILTSRIIDKNKLTPNFFTHVYSSLMGNNKVKINLDSCTLIGLETLEEATDDTSIAIKMLEWIQKERISDFVAVSNNEDNSNENTKEPYVEEHKAKHAYKIDKIEIANNKVVSSWYFDTLEEAEQYIENIKNKYPSLLNLYKLEIKGI